jgi:hypothetical protein
MLKTLKNCASVTLLATCLMSSAAAIESVKKPTGSAANDKESSSLQKQAPAGDGNNNSSKTTGMGGFKSGQLHDPACLFTSFAVTGLSVTMSTYSTVGYGPCDTETYDKMSTPSIRASMAITRPVPYDILKLGAIRSTATNSQYSLSLPYQFIGPLKFTMIAQTVLPMGTMISNPDMLKRGFAGTPYTPYPSVEKSYFYWAPGTLIYELIDPQGKKYVMTNFSNQYFRDISFGDLKYLDEVLRYPQGWSFKMRVINKVLEVRTTQRNNYTTIRVVDDLANIYVIMDN